MSWEGARVVAERLVVPSNCSRLLLTRDLAVGVPTATVELAWNDEDPYLFNARFEGSKIVHDDAYCTSVVDLEQVVQIPTLSCLHDRVLPQLLDAPTVIDIGCGQGEFVSALRAADVNAAGFDPVLRTESEHLHRRYWTPGEGPADLFVMRCVLPHIAEPWSFLEEIAAASPRGMVLIEFQRLEWILAESVWYQISHDHVNVFSVDDFEARYEVVDNGIFSNGEWAWGAHPPRRCPCTSLEAVGP